MIGLWVVFVTDNEAMIRKNTSTKVMVITDAAALITEFSRRIAVGVALVATVAMTPIYFLAFLYYIADLAWLNQC